jgi:ABC-type microcin C transport system permease subunit YejB
MKSSQGGFMNGKVMFVVIAVLVGAIGYYLWSQIPPTPKEQTLSGYTQGLQNSEKKAQTVASTANVENVQQAVEKYKVMKGTNPPSLQDLVPEYLDHVPGGLQYDAGTGTVSAAQ